MIKLHKCSTPGWTKEFETELELKQELLKYICHSCVEGYEEYYGEDIVYKSDPLDIDSNIDEILSTACGCEFMVDR